MDQNKKIVFFGCSIRGGHSFVPRDDLAKIIEIIENNNCILISKHQIQIDIIEKENLLIKEEIHDRDYEWLLESDFGIFEISNPSLGVGSEIADMVNIGKPVLCLFKEGIRENVSAYILGKEKSKYVNTIFECHSYGSLGEVEEIIKIFIKKNIWEK